jgi:hypothetical protein
MQTHISFVASLKPNQTKQQQQTFLASFASFLPCYIYLVTFPHSFFYVFVSLLLEKVQQWRNLSAYNCAKSVDLIYQLIILLNGTAQG